MLMPFLFAAVGLVLLLIGGDALVKGAVNLSLRLGLSALIVSLTVVAFGTSAPELLIAIEALDDGAPGLALGNVVGSNTANVLLVLGIPAILARMETSGCDTKRDFVFMFASSLLFVAMCFMGQLTWVSGVILLSLIIGYLGFAFWRASTGREKPEELEEADPDMPYWKIFGFLIAGLIALPLGADLLVDNSIIIARSFGISEVVIGLTLVAIGTSLPELATTVMAALRRHADVALGNVIGSNMFNLLGIMGIASLISPIPVDQSFLWVDLWVMLGASLMLVPFVFFKQDITRIWGLLLTALYGGYLLFLLG